MKYLKYIILSFAIFTLLSTYISIRTNAELPLSEHTLVNNPLYNLSPITLYGTSNPTLDNDNNKITSPELKKYFFTKIVERLDIMGGKKTHLDAASQRIKELEFVTNETYRIKTTPLKYVQNILDEYKREIYLEFKYVESLKSIYKHQEQVKVYYLLQDHHHKVNRTIYQLQDGDVKKKLFSYVDTLFIELTSELKTKGVFNDISSTIYKFQDLLSSKEYGVYSALIKKTDTEPYWETVRLLNGKKVYELIGQNSYTRETVTQSYYGFSNVLIKENSPYLTLINTPLNIIPPTNWTVLQKDEKYEYIKTFPWKYTNQKYVFKSEFRSDNPISILLYDLNEYKTLAWSENVVSPYSYITSETNIVLQSNQSNNTLVLKIISPLQLSSEALNSIKLTLTPIISPSITLSRNQYLPNKEQSFQISKTGPHMVRVAITNNSDSYLNEILHQLADTPWKAIRSSSESTNIMNVDFIYVPGIVCLFLSMLSFFLILLLIVHYALFKYASKDYLSFKNYLHLKLQLGTQALSRLLGYVRQVFFLTLKYCKHMLRRIRLALLILSAISIAFYALQQSFFRDYILIYIFSIWLLATIGYQIQSNISFSLALLFLFLAGSFLIVNNGYRAEIFATWSYFFIISGTITLIIEFYFNSYKSRGILQLLRACGVDLSTMRDQPGIGKQVYEIVHYIVLIIVKILKKYYGISNYEIIFTDKKILKKFIVRNLILLLICISSYISIVQIVSYLNFKKHYPKIDFIQPSIVYYGDRVLIKGKNFGASKLKSDRWNRINIDLLADDKAIFTMPLDWQAGQAEVWFEKQVSWNGKLYDLSSNKVKIRLIPRSDSWTKDDDEYYKLKEKWSEETKELNK